MTIRAVVDTSALFPFEQRRELQTLALAGAFTGIWSPVIIGELYRVLTWRAIDAQAEALPGDIGKHAMKCDLSDDVWRRISLASKKMMDLFLANPNWEWVYPRLPYPKAWETLTDEWDKPIWAAAVEGQAQYVVSENTNDYPPEDVNGRHVYQGVEYLGGQAFIALLIKGVD